jgi:signal transduction histidine kinase
VADAETDPGGVASVPSSSRASPVWAHLVIGTFAVLLPLLGLLGAGAWVYVQQARAEDERQTLLTARRLAATVDRELASFTGMLAALATSPVLLDGDLERLHRQASSIVPEDGVIVLRDRTGRQLINTLFPVGAPLPATRPPAVRDADDCVIRTRAVCASNLYVGTTDPQPYVLLNAPVFRNGEIAYTLNIAFRARHLAGVLAQAVPSAQWSASLFDARNIVIARSRDHDRFVGQAATSRLTSNATGLESAFRAVTLDGDPVWAAQVLLPNWGWRVAVGVPQAVLDVPLRRSALYLAAFALLAVVLSVGTAVIFGRRLARSIAALSHTATRVGRGEELAPVTTRITEVNHVSAALATASRELRRTLGERDAAQDGLQALNGQLEARIRAEVAAREEAQARVAHADRMRALGQLAGGIAHDFNNVLQATRGCAATIQKRAEDPEAVRRFSRLILDASERGSSVTRRLLTFSQQNTLKAEAVDLRALLAGLQELLSHTLGRHIAVHLVLPPDLPQVLADRGQLETVLVNLATNARDAMEGGGSLVLAAAAQAVAIGGDDGTGLEPGGYVRITVSDTGIGMDAATLARATEPFFTTKGRREGTGLGLAMARGFAEQSGGRLLIESRPGQGTAVSLWLRAVDADAVQVEGMGAMAAAAAGEAGRAERRRRVLLVEDEDIVRTVLAAQLEDEGCLVLQASGAREALGVLEGSPAVDALITDLNMPGMSGLDLIRAVRGLGHAMPAILLTGNAGDGTPLAIEGALTRNFSLLRKPVLGRELADRIASLTAEA